MTPTTIDGIDLRDPFDGDGAGAMPGVPIIIPGISDHWSCATAANTKTAKQAVKAAAMIEGAISALPRQLTVGSYFVSCFHLLYNLSIYIGGAALSMRWGQWVIPLPALLLGIRRLKLWSPTCPHYDHAHVSVSCTCRIRVDERDLEFA